MAHRWLPRCSTLPGDGIGFELATYTADEGGVYVLDEPATGLRLADLEHLLDRFDYEDGVAPSS